MSGLINKAKEMLGGHHEETGNSNTHGSHHNPEHTGSSTIGTTGEADKYASGYGGKSANTTGNPMPIDKLTGHSSSNTTSSEYKNTGSGLGSDRIGDNTSSLGSSGYTGSSTNYDNNSSSGLGSGLTGSSTHGHHHESSGLGSSGRGVTSGLTGGSSNYESSGMTGSGMGSGMTGSSGLTGTSGYGQTTSHGHVAQEGTAEYERIRAEMAQHGHSGYGSGLQNSVQAAASEFSGPGHHTHHTDHNIGGQRSSGMTSGSGLTGHSSSDRDYDNSKSSSGGGLMDKLTGSNKSSDRYDDNSRSDRTDRYDNSSTVTGSGYDNDSSRGQHQEGGLKGMMNKVMGKDDTTSSNTHGTHGSHMGTGASGQPRNTDY